MHMMNAARMATAAMLVRLRRVVILSVTCISLCAASPIAPASASTYALPTSCGGDLCFAQNAIHSAGFVAWAQSVGFFGHFQLQTPEHTTINTTPNLQWNVGVQAKVFGAPNVSGYYCMTAWQLVGTNGYNKIGYACMTITV